MPTADPRAASQRRLHPLLAAVLTALATGCDDAPTQQPPRGAPAPTSATATDPAAPTPRPEPRWRHPLGIALDPPPGWQVGEALGAIQLTPPDPATHAGQPAELHVVTMLGADPSIDSLDAPRAASELAKLVRIRLPFVRPVDGPSRVAERDDARRFTFRGVSPDGVEIECRVTGILADGWFLAVSSAATPTTLARRATALAEVERSLRHLPPRTDPALASTWHAYGSSSAGDPGDRIHVTTSTGTTLHPDGSVTSASRGMVFGTTGGDRRPGSSVTGLHEFAGSDGLWARAPEGDLYLLWRDGSSARWQVHLQGQPGRRELLLRSPTDRRRKLLWTEYPQ